MKRNGFFRAAALLIAAFMLMGASSSLFGIGFSGVSASGSASEAFPELTYPVSDGSKIVLGKDAYLTEDGTYTIDLSAYSVGTPNIKQRTAKIATDYIIVVDSSGSMKDTVTAYWPSATASNAVNLSPNHHSAIKQAVKAFIAELEADSTTFENTDWNLDHRVALVSYARGNQGKWTSSSSGGYFDYTPIYDNTGIYTYKYDDGELKVDYHEYEGGTIAAGETTAQSVYNKAFMSVVDEFNELNFLADNIPVGGSTNMQLGMEMAKGIIDESPNNEEDEHYNEYYDQQKEEWVERPKVVLFFTDGLAGITGCNPTYVKQTIEYANQIKADGKIKIYTVGLIAYSVFDLNCDTFCGDFVVSTTTLYGGHGNSSGELQVNTYTFEDFTNGSDPVGLGDENRYYFNAWGKLKTDLGLTTNAQIKAKYAEVQKNQYRMMGLTRNFLAIDPLVAISSEYDYVDVSLVNDFSNSYGFTSWWPLYDKDGNRKYPNKTGFTYGWYKTGPALDLKDENGDRIGGRYSAIMRNTLDGTNSNGAGYGYTSANPIWKKLYKSTTENLLTYDPASGKYRYMNVEVPVVVQDARYVNGVRKGFIYEPNPDLKYYVPLVNAIDEAGQLGTDNIRRLVAAFKQIQEVSFEEQTGITPASGITELGSITDKISENFVLPGDFEASPEKYVEVYLAPVDSANTTAAKWMFSSPVRQNSLQKIASELSDDEVAARLYSGSNARFGVKYDASARTVTILGFRWNEDGWYCVKNGNTYQGKKLIVRIKGITAKDDVIPSIALPTNDAQFSGMNQNWKDSKPATLETTNGIEKLLFPEPKVSIREKNIVYDYGLRLVDDNLPGFFGEEGDANDVEHLLSIDYMYRAQYNKNGERKYHGSYPYDGAEGRDIYGEPITYGTDIAHDEDGFKIGFTMNGSEVDEYDYTAHSHGDGCIGYFEPHTISHRDYRVAALLELSGTQKDVFGNSLKRYEWCRLSIIPASNVLYEAEQGVSQDGLTGNFVEYTNSSFASSGSWSIEGSFDSASTQQHYNKLYGYDPDYENGLDCDANGASMKVTVDQQLYEAVKVKEASWPTAKFSFKGSGFSFTSRCGLGTGIFIVDVVPRGQDQKYNGTAGHPATGGYTAVEGDNYHTLVNTRYYGGTETPDGTALLHQIPVFRRGHMPYMDYDVYLTPVYYPSWANDPTGSVSTKSGEEIGMRLDELIPGVGDIEYTITNAVENGGAEVEPARGKLSSFTAYVDTVRIYHPLGAKIHAKDTDAVEYYHAHELNAKYVETRTLLINSIQNLAHGDEEGNISGAIFIDYGPEGEGGSSHYNADDPTTYLISDYAKFGPNNEMYLKGMTEGSSAGGSFTFAIANPDKVTNLHLSMKAHESRRQAEVKVRFLLKNGGAYEVIGGVENNVSVNSTAEMYYDLFKGLTDAQNVNIAGVVLECTGEVTLSIVNLKIVYEEGYVETGETDAIGTRAGGGFNSAGIVTTLESAEFANAIAFGVKGDANGDNAVDMLDALLIMRKSLDGEAEFGISATYLADVNANSTIDITDALEVMRLALN